MGVWMMRSKRILLAVIALCVITLWSIGTLAQQGTDCRRRKEPPRKGALDLTGEWMDNSVTLKVRIIQLGSNLNGYFGEVSAAYLTPYKCEYPASTGSGGSTPTEVKLDNDFTGHLKTNTIEEGEVYICQTKTRGKTDDETAMPGTFIPHLETYSEVVTGKLKDMTVSDDGNSIRGTFDDPAKGNQPISFTRLSTPDKSPFYPTGPITTTATTKIYADASTNSVVGYTVPPGTQLTFVDVKLDADGNPTWYVVVNRGEGGATSKNTGAIRAANITCGNASPKVPGKTG